MRITAKAKAETRGRILDVARRLFGKGGYAETTTRDIARAASIATGTLFNYFPNKEALGMTLLAEALERGGDDFRRQRRGEEALDEDLFAHVASGLRRLEPHRAFTAEVIELAMTPLGGPAASEQADALRRAHMATVAEVIEEHRPGMDVPFVSLHLYWTLYLGVLSFWSRDTSPHQEDAFVLLDRSLRLFVGSLDAHREDPAGGPAGATP